MCACACARGGGRLCDEVALQQGFGHVKAVFVELKSSLSVRVNLSRFNASQHDDGVKKDITEEHSYFWGGGSRR